MCHNEVNLVTHTEGVREQGVEGDIWTYDGGT